MLLNFSDFLFVSKRFGDHRVRSNNKSNREKTKTDNNRRIDRIIKLEISGQTTILKLRPQMSLEESADKLLDSFNKLIKSHYDIKLNELTCLTELNKSHYHQFEQLNRQIKELNTATQITEEKVMLLSNFIIKLEDTEQQIDIFGKIIESLKKKINVLKTRYLIASKS